MRQTDRRTGTICGCEAEARWDPRGRRSRHGWHEPVGHAGPTQTGEVVTDEPIRAPSPGPRRELCGACASPDAVADESGVAAAPGRALPGTWGQVLTLAHHVVFWFNKNCAEIALIFGQRTHRFLRSIRIA